MKEEEKFLNVRLVIKMGTKREVEGQTWKIIRNHKQSSLIAKKNQSTKN